MRKENTRTNAERLNLLKEKFFFYLKLSSSMRNCFNKIFNFHWQPVQHRAYIERGFSQHYSIGSYLPDLVVNSLVVFVYNEYLAEFFNPRPYKDNKRGHLKCLISWSRICDKKPSIFLRDIFLVAQFQVVHSLVWEEKHAYWFLWFLLWVELLWAAKFVYWTLSLQCLNIWLYLDIRLLHN